MDNVNRFLRYIWYVIKDIFMVICFVLDVIGIVVVYQTDIVIPIWVYITVLAVGFIIANYKLYVDNATEITVNTSLIKNNPCKVSEFGNKYVNLMVYYNLYIHNLSNNAGVVERINVELKSFSKCKDQFLLDRVGIKYKGFFITDEEMYVNFSALRTTKGTEFPIIIEPKGLLNKILVLYIDINGKDEADYKNILEWMGDIEFIVTVGIENNNVEKQSKYKIKVFKNDIEQIWRLKMRAKELTAKISKALDV